VCGESYIFSSNLEKCEEVSFEEGIIFGKRMKTEKYLSTS